MRAGVEEEVTGLVAAVDVPGLYAQHRLPLIRLAVLLVDDRESAEDVVQDAFVALHRKQAEISDANAALAYLRACVVNGSRSMLRRRRTVRHRGQAFAAGERAAEGADTELILAEEHREVLAAVRTLPVRQREVLVLRYWSGLSEAEIAAAMGVSAGTVKSTASKAVDKVARQLGEPR